MARPTQCGGCKWMVSQEGRHECHYYPPVFAGFHDPRQLAAWGHPQVEPGEPACAVAEPA